MKFHRKVGRAGDVQPDINVTPLVDVVLVLLIIFMVVAPQLDQDIQVQLPGMFNPDPSRAFDPIRVTVAQAGEYRIEGRQYDLDGAIAHLATQHEIDPMRPLVLRADAKLTYGDVRAIFARCQKVGFPGMSLLVGERHDPGAAGDGERRGEEPARQRRDDRQEVEPWP